jgi:NADH-quinone oxidoreductase subunit L
MTLQQMLLLIPGIPLFAFLMLGLYGKKIPGRYAALAGTLLMGITMVICCFVAFGYFVEFGKVAGAYQPVVPVLMHWLRLTDSLDINLGVLLDSISCLMLFVVSFISLMVHIYSMAYMKDEPRIAAYYAFLSLFTFAMLGLVMASNIFQLYIFWELVGLSSFLLIGFYYQKPAAVRAAKKAFIVTRFADLGMLIGILIISYDGKSLDFLSLIDHFTNSPQQISGTFLGIASLQWALALIFIGGAGKSALFPLHIWLPDAMEGPTPVSALIHAATMVVAGVFLVARLFPVYAIAAPDLLQGIGYVGAFTALFAALIACTQTDIKRILAYSTMSQIGYMFVALGVAGYAAEAGLGFTASLFHLFTHALFKALLFLCAGAVIHLVHSNEMRDMGGLMKLMPITHLCFLIGCLAIAGIPPFSGFFSKEEILLAAYQHNKFIYYVSLFTAGLTAFYMFRLYFSIFWNKSFQEHHSHHGEGGPAMMLTLIILGIGSVVAGFVPFGKWVSSDGRPLISHFHLSFSILPVLLSLAGIAIAAFYFFKKKDNVETIVNAMGGLFRAAKGKFYIDEIYQFITKKIIFNLIAKPAAWIDKNLIDGLVNTMGNSTVSLSNQIKGIQSGKIQLYAGIFLVGVIGLAILTIYYWN